ncbi:MAG TPA: GH92 family glycosyl hydrolase [Candidatus Kryptonia bacterium]
MKTSFVILAKLSILIPISVPAQSHKAPLDYVNPAIGGVSLLLSTTKPIVQLPHDYPQVTPVLNPGLNDSYLATKVYGFPAGAIVLMPGIGSVKTDPDEIASDFDRDFETRTPYFYQVLLDDYGIETSFTAGHFSVFYRFKYSGTDTNLINVMMADSGTIRIISQTEIEGSTEVNDVPYYFYLKFSEPFGDAKSWDYGGVPDSRTEIEGRKIGITLVFTRSKERMIQVKSGLSFISLDQARKNLGESIHGWDFEKRIQETKSAWERLLGKIEVKGGTDKEKTIFYTSLYRAEQNMTDITEDGKYYSGYDHAVHDSHGRDFYTDDQLWDTFRCEHPLQLLLDPIQQEDIIQSYIRMYEEWGWLPLFPRIYGEFPAMIGQHANALIADAYFKGYRDFDVAKAYEAMKKEAMRATMLPWRNGIMDMLDSIYLEKGYFPALKEGETETNPNVHPFERRQAVSVTLETAYDDWCLAMMAKELGHSDDYGYFLKRAYNYKKVFDTTIGFMAPKTADGEWVKGFDPTLPSGPGGRDYFSECNSWIYTFSVMHDMTGLIQLFGGRKEFLSKLDSLFEAQYGGIWKYSFLGKFPDMTGLIGNYAQGNEPSFHIPYIYDFAGEPWKAQKIIREILEVWYNDSPLGIPGDDDLGAMGSWYVFSSMGFYPFCPGASYYVIGSPIFKEVTIHLAGGNSFDIKADNVSIQNKYIESATLNGKPLMKPWFTQEDLAHGGILELQMGPRPNKSWGSAPEDAPPSMSDK